MRRLHLWPVFTLIPALLFLLPVNGLCGWELYDNFSSGVINPNLWTVDDSSADISVVNGKVRFVHKSGFADDASFLAVKKDVSLIKGVRARVQVVSASGDIRARIGGWVGTLTSGNKVWQEIRVTPSKNKISAVADAESNGEWLYNFFWTDFKAPITIKGKWFVLTANPSAAPKVTYSVTGQGTTVFTLPITGLTQSPHSHTIGTKSGDGTGAGTVYFDDVYVLK